MENIITAFTKPWPQSSVDELADKLSSFGFTGVELCVRKGYQVYSEENLSASLCNAVNVFSGKGIKVVGIGGNIDEKTISACADAHISYIRTLMSIPRECPEIDAVLKESKRKIAVAKEYAEKYKVTIGIQLHIDTYAWNSIQLHELVDYFDSPYIKGIWDSAQCTMAGEQIGFGLSFILPDCISVQIKNLRFKNPGVEIVSGKDGIVSWGEIIKTLNSHNYKGVITLTHEYSDSSKVEELYREDALYIKQLQEGCK